MAFLEQWWHLLLVVMLDHFISKRIVIDSSFVSPSSSIWVPVVHPSLIVPIASVHIHQIAKCFFWKLRTFKNIAELCWTYHSIFVVSVLKPLFSKVILFHMKFKVVFILEFLFANEALLVERFQLFFFRILVDLVLDHSKIIKLAEISIINHIDSKLLENRFDFPIDSINHVLRMHPGAEIVLEVVILLQVLSCSFSIFYYL